jgi:hypothetical protein
MSTFQSSLSTFIFLLLCLAVVPLFRLLYKLCHSIDHFKLISLITAKPFSQLEISTPIITRYAISQKFKTLPKEWIVLS